MYHYRLVILYKGSNYFGWQDLGVSEEKPTIQASIQQVLNKICKNESGTVSAASRTDAGVHAQGQVVKITIPIEIKSQMLLLGMNSLLPADIRILECQSCASEFNANRDSTSKEYHYYFCTDTVHNPIFNDIVAHIPSNGKSSTDASLDIKRIKEGCQLFVGEHDFYSFAKRDTSMNSTVRTIISCEIVKAQPLGFGNNVYYLKIVGEGFLRYMVRYIVGALFQLGRNQLSLSDINEALAHHKEEKISARAKAKGLHLIEIFY